MITTMNGNRSLRPKPKTSIHACLALLCVCIVVGCNKKDGIEEKSKPVFAKTYYSDGILMSEYAIIHDSVKHGPYKKFYKNGNVEFEVLFSFNKKEGEEKGYYETGELNYIIPYSDNIKSGLSKWYFKNGKAQADIPYYKGNAVGELYYYFQNGRTESYLVNDFNGKPKFNVTFDSLGKITNISGTAVVDVSHNGESLHIGDTLKVLFLVATPPKSEFNFFIWGDLSNKSDMKELVIDSVNNVVRWIKPVTKLGTTNWGGYIQMKFENGTKKNYSFKGKLIGTN